MSFDKNFEDNREKIPLTQVFYVAKNVIEPKKKADKPKNKKIELIKDVSEPIWPAPIPAFPIFILLSKVKIMERKEVSTQSGLSSIRL